MVWGVERARIWIVVHDDYLLGPHYLDNNKTSVDRGLRIRHIFNPIVSVRGSLFRKKLTTPRSIHTRISPMATWTFVRSFDTEINRE